MNQNMQISPPSKGITDLIDVVHKGEFKQRLDAELRELVESVESTGKGGSLSIKINLTPNAKLAAIEVSGEVVTKKPKPPMRASLFFATPEHNLSRVDVKQPDMFEGGHHE